MLLVNDTVSAPIPLLVIPFEEKDLTAILRLEAENPFAWSHRQWLDGLAQPNGWQWLACCRQSGDVLGYICGRSVLDEAEVFKLAVAAASRRRGVATLLLAHTCRELKHAGIKKCYLELRISNTAARALYARMGFSPHGIRKDYYGANDDALLMLKRF
jgi:[ribosomal protein S18]-alanine N-acetyltransferase